MRGDTRLLARLLLRPSGLAGAGVALGGIVALAGAYLPWYSVTVRLTMLEEEQTRSVADLAGWASHPWGWLIPALGAVATILGVAIAIDRPPARTRLLLMVGAAALAVGAVAGALRQPEVARFDIAGSRLRELVDLAERLPSGVELGFTVALADGVWVTLGAAGLVLVGTLLARELP